MFVTYVPETTDYGLATRKHMIGVNLSVRLIGRRGPHLMASRPRFSSVIAKRIALSS